jgi:comEA protein
VVKDSGITLAFEEEFEMMWGSSTEKPDPSRARFKRNKQNVSQNEFWVDQTRVELYFSPMNRDRSRPGVSNRIVELIETETDHDLAFVAFAITPTIPISRAIWSVSADPDIILNGVIDRSFYGRYRNQGEIWASPEARVLGRSVLPGRELRKLHHKTLLIDAMNEDPDDTAIVISGSYNFSAAAENANDEYVFIIHCDIIANQFLQDFKGIKSRARGDTDPPVPALDPGQWYPVAGVVDGQVIEVELSPNLRFPVSLIGVDAPRMFAGRDSSHYHAGASKAWLEKILEGREVRMEGPGGVVPTDNRGRYYAYVNARDAEGNEIAVNRKMLKHGMADYSRFYLQHPDSIQAYRDLTDAARAAGINYWKEPDKIKMRVPRHQESDDVDPEPEFPININSATEDELTALPGIGPARARAIIEYRETNGPFRSVNDLQQIRGIGPGIVGNLEPLVEV